MKACLPLTALLCALLPATATAAPESGEEMLRALRPFVEVLGGERERFRLAFRFQFPMDGKTERVAGAFERRDAESFRLTLVHRKYAFRLLRNADATALLLPRHRTAFVSRGPVRGPDRLAPQDALDRLVTERSAASLYLSYARAGTVLGAEALADLAADSLAETLRTRPDPPALDYDDGRVSGSLTLLPAGRDPVAVEVPEGYKTVELDRTEMERVLSRGVRRALEVLAPVERRHLRAALVPNGSMKTLDGHPVVLLAGTPEEVGRAHGALLAEEARLCVDSTLYLVGTAFALDRGRWFPDELRAAWKRLEPHVPKDHLREMDALADQLGMDRETVRISNAFPELFHCSGFALMGKATVGGKLYHGRVLDYMTMIGLQDSAVTFVVQVDGKRPFVNVGYAGFIGCVSGMNDRQISLGEMGGRGEGNWDGVPMATLMRRALEECETLDEVIELWRSSPRTCEYFYVFADGKVPDAVGVGATPEELVIIRAGADHPRLGEGIPDAVVLSAGGRLEELRRRVKEGYGEIDAEAAIRLMSRPVAMKSNLHNVLFVPQDLVLYVAHAGQGRPAAERPYLRIDFAGLLPELGRLRAPTKKQE